MWGWGCGVSSRRRRRFLALQYLGRGFKFPSRRFPFVPDFSRLCRSLLLVYIIPHHLVAPYFTQEDPRAADDDDVLLFQLDSEGHGDEVDIMWGDSGIGMFFIRPADLRARRFERAWFYWDCC